MTQLSPVPANYPAQRDDLHRVAAYLIAPARYTVTDRFGLRSLPGGFGTPRFDDDVQVRVDADGLVLDRDGDITSSPLTTLDAASAFLGAPIDSETAAEPDTPALGATDAPLSTTPETIAFLGAWWALGTAALEVIRSDPNSVDASIVQLWPGHFDVAIEVGDENRRASVGASPGDAGAPEPYLYVSVWWPDRLALDTNDPYWNAEGFVGARLPYAELLIAEDPHASAVEFFRMGRDLLAAAADQPS